MVIRNIIFDWSGTLVDDLPATWEATNHVFRNAGIAEMSLDTFRAEFSLPFIHFYERYLPNHPMPQLEAWFHERFRVAQDKVAPLAHAIEFLEFCRKQRIKCYVLSSVHRSHFQTQSRACGFGEYFDRPYIEVLDKRKQIHKIIENHQLDPGETLFIGDMQHDIETAQHGGVHSCAVLTGYNKLDQLRASHPDLIVEHLGELLALLQNHGLDFHSVISTSNRGHHSVPIATVGALIFESAGRGLMIRTQKWSNLWGIPGGKIKYEESSIDALKREIKEETALDIDDIRFVMVQDCIRSKEFYQRAHFILLNYTCRMRGDQPVVLNEEAQEFKWLPFNDAFELDLNRPTRILLEAVRDEMINSNRLV